MSALPFLPGNSFTDPTVSASEIDGVGAVVLKISLVNLIQFSWSVLYVYDNLDSTFIVRLKLKLSAK